MTYDPGPLRLLVAERHLPGKHDQSTHGHGLGGKNWRKTNDDAEAALTATAQTPLTKSTSLGGGWSASVRIEEHEGGTLIRKEFPPGDAIRSAKDQVDAEHLGSLVAHAVGVRSPAVVPQGEDSIIMEHVHGKTWAEQSHLGSPPAHILNSDEGRLLGLHDILIGNPDRNSGNWMTTTDGGHLVAIDHGLAFSSRWAAGTSSWFAGHFIAAKGNDWADHIDISPHDMATIRGRLTDIRGEFVAAGRTSWYDHLIERLDVLQPRATGTISRLS